MLAPVARLKKSEIIWLSKHRCKHRHTYLQHYECYLNENPQNLRIGFFDTENSALDAEWGIMLCYCIKERGRGIIHNVIDKKDLLSSTEDKKLVRQCVEDLKGFDRIITYYGTGYDFPFVRTRAALHNIPFMSFGELWHDDVYYIIKSKFKLQRNRQENACRTILGRTLKTHVKPKIWRKALQGNKDSLNWILDHCKRDVKDLEKLHNKVITYKKRTDKSI